MWSRIITAIIVLAVAGGLAWALWPRPIEVETETTERRDLEVTIEADGVSRIRDVVRLSAPIAGLLGRVDLRVGDAVTEGQVLATIRPADPGLLDERSRRVAEASVAAAEAAVEMARAAVSQARSQNAFAQAERERSQRLAERGLISTQALDRAELEADNAARAIELARATLQMRERELESARAALVQGQTDPAADVCCVEIAAPIAGRVLAVLAEDEQVIASGTPIIEIGDPGNLQIEVDVLSTDAVRIPDNAAAVVEGWGGPPLQARVESIDPVAVTRVSALGIEEQRTRVVLSLEEDRDRFARLGHGFRVTARIVLWRGEDVLAVPLGALFRRGAEWAVFVVREGSAELRTLALGHRNREHAEVLSGLAAGEDVIVHPSDTLADGAAVARAGEGGHGL